MREREREKSCFVYNLYNKEYNSNIQKAKIPKTNLRQSNS